MQCLGLTGACAACSHCTATAWELSDLDHSHAAIPQRVTRASCAQLLLLRSNFCAWRRLLLICWKLLIGVCVYETGLLLLFAYIALLLLPLSFVLGGWGWRAVAFPRWLHLRDRSGSPRLIVILMVRCCFGGLLCVRDKLAACLRVSHFCCFR